MVGQKIQTKLRVTGSSAGEANICSFDPKFLALLPLINTAGQTLWFTAGKHEPQRKPRRSHASQTDSALVWDVCRLVPPEPRFQLPSVWFLDCV